MLPSKDDGFAERFALPVSTADRFERRVLILADDNGGQRAAAVRDDLPSHLSLELFDSASAIPDTATISVRPLLVVDPMRLTDNEFLRLCELVTAQRAGLIVYTRLPEVAAQRVLQLLRTGEVEIVI